MKAFFKKCLIQKYQDQNGYTIVEMLVASALLIMALIPTLLYLGRIVHSPKSRQIITATYLAQSRMEKTIAESYFETIEEIQKIDHHEFVVQQEVRTQQELVVITVSVFREKNSKPLITLQKCRMIR